MLLGPSVSLLIKDHQKKFLLFVLQYDKADLNCSGLPYIPLCEKPIILFLQSEYSFTDPYLYVSPTHISNTIAIPIAVDISRIEDVLDSPCLDFVTKLVFSGAFNKMLTITTPLVFVFWSYIVYF
jgi:hypothetical protein